MPVPYLAAALRRLRRDMDRTGLSAPTDGELLGRFASVRDEGAFELLVWRHGPAILGLCRRLLHREQDAEDAFQATFLALARKAGAIRSGQSVGGWLFTVAHRVAWRLRRRKDLLAGQPFDGQAEPEAPPTKMPDRDICAVVDEEVQRLPDKYRAAVVLCYLEGKSNTEAALELGCPRGTIDSRLSWARQRLRSRLLRRGVTLSVTAALGHFWASACPAVPANIVHTTVSLAGHFAARSAMTALANVPSSLVIARGALRMMFLAKLQKGLFATLAVAIVALCSWGLVGAPAPAEAQVVPIPKPPQPVPPPEQAETKTDTGGWRLAGVLKGHTIGVWCVAFSPDGKLMATGAGGAGDKPGEVGIWDTETSRLLSKTSTERSVRSVAFSPDGRALATAELDGVVRLLDLPTGKLRWQMERGAKLAHAVQFSPDGRRLAVAVWDLGAQIVPVQPDDTRALLVCKVAGDGGEVSSVAFSPDGKALVTGGNDGAVTMWDTATGKEQRRLEGHKRAVESVAFSRDGRRLATASWDKTAAIWDVASGKEITRLAGHKEQVLCVAFSPDQKTLATSSGRWGDYDYSPGPGEVILWDLARGQILARLAGHTDRVFGVAFSPDGTRLASASWDRTVRVWARAGAAAGAGPRGPATGGGVVADRLEQLLDQLLKSDRSNEQIAEALTLATLGRLPTDGERTRFASLERGNRRAQFEAFLRALTASSECQAHQQALQQRSGHPSGAGSSYLRPVSESSSSGVQRR